MAGYNNGFPVTYPQPVYFPQMPAQQPQQQNQNQNNIIWVQGEAGEKSYLVAPNTTVPLWDSENQVIYLKSADAMGRPTVKILDYTIRDQEVKDASPEYVTKADFEAFEERILKKLDQRPNYPQKRYSKEDRNDG